MKSKKHGRSLIDTKSHKVMMPMKRRDGSWSEVYYVAAKFLSKEHLDVFLANYKGECPTKVVSPNRGSQ